MTLTRTKDNQVCYMWWCLKLKNIIREKKLNDYNNLIEKNKLKKIPL
jgi:prenyltransferase beta subunit